MRITRPFVLLALAALLAPRIEASCTSVWERNPPAAFSVARTEAASALAALAPAAAADVEAAEPPLFNLGDVILVEGALESEDRFGIGPVDLLGPTPLRGPPPSYPETRVGGFELLPPFRVGASPSLSLWPRQACGFSCGEVASDSRYDPWGLRALNDQDKGRIREFNDEARRLRGLLASGAKNQKEIDEALDEIEKMRHSFVEAVRAAREDQPILAQQAPASFLDPRQVTRYGPQPSAPEIEDRNRDAYKWKFWTVDVPTTVSVFALPHVVNAGPRAVEQYQAERPFERYVRNPYGSKGTPAHRRTIDELVKKAAEEFPNDIVHREARLPGTRRNPDVWVEDSLTGSPKKIYEAARKEKSGDFVRRERAKKELYDKMGIPSHFEEVIEGAPQ